MSLRERIHCLPLPTPFHVGPVNVYLIEGEPLTLLDCGVGTDDSYQALVTGLAELGYTIHDLEQVIVSHHHTDHLGMAARIIEESGAQLLAHRYTVPYLETPLTPRERDLDFFVTISREGGVPDEIIDTFALSMKWVEQFANAPVKVKQALSEGDTVRAGDADWHVYHTPGHAGDLICLYEPDSRMMLASDHLLLKISSNPLIEPPPEPDIKQRPRRLVEYIHHMQRMAELNPAIAYPGHGAPVEDVPSLVQQRVDFHHQRAKRILHLFDEGEHNLWQLTEKLFAHVPKTEKFLALSEVLGHVDILEDQGHLGREYRDGILFWRRCPNAAGSS
jgi:glyoxylase-like metal-dependent hydrolase (beta-lactamase superfamily II)